MTEKEVITILVDKEHRGLRLDAFLSMITPEELSRSHIQKLLEEDQVLVNGVVEKQKKYQVKEKDQILLKIPEPKQLSVEAEDIPIDIVYEDQDLVVVNKQKGLVVHPAAGNETGTLVNALLHHLKDLSGIGGVLRPGIVHRIDKDTSGLIVIAKNDHAHQCLTEQWKEHAITRRYYALVHHNIKEEEGTIVGDIGRHPGNRLKMAVVSEGGRHAITHYRVLERFGQFTLLEVSLETGRTHQIRVHMAHIKHPLAGDFVYGPQKAVYGVKTQLLHAKVLGFIHPSTKQYMEFDSELPEEFQRVLKILRNNI